MPQTEWSRLLDIKRNDITERTIFGSIVTADRNKIITKTDSDPTIFGRSLTKPFQMKAVAIELAGVLDWQEKAISLASHNGTPDHVRVAKQILSENDYKYLALPASAPLAASLQPAEKSQWFNPCSGKHSAIIRACQLNGWSLTDYTSPAHPYNQAYKQILESRLGVELNKRTVAPDGCLLPTCAMQVSELARLFASLAYESDQDWIWEAHRRHPELIGGQGRLDTLLMQAIPNIIAKEGADGLLGLSVKEDQYNAGLGIVIKLAHGYDPQIMWHLARHTLNDFNLSAPAPPGFPGQTIEIC